MQDLEGKPLYHFQECPTCKEWKEKELEEVVLENGYSKKRLKGVLPCQGCWQDIEPIPEVPFGYQGLITHHWHIRSQNLQTGGLGIQGILKRLCPVCYRKEWIVVYPDLPCRV